MNNITEYRFTQSKEKTTEEIRKRLHTQCDYRYRITLKIIYDERYIMLCVDYNLFSPRTKKDIPDFEILANAERKGLKQDKTMHDKLYRAFGRHIDEALSENYIVTFKGFDI